MKAVRSFIDAIRRTIAADLVRIWRSFCRDLWLLSGECEQPERRLHFQLLHYAPFAINFTQLADCSGDDNLAEISDA
jgi:hypothetical protein